MEDFSGILARDFGYKPQGKSAPMAPPRSSPNNTSYGIGSNARSSAPIFDDHRDSPDGALFNDVFGGPPKYSADPRSSPSAPPPPSSSSPSFDYDDIFKDRNSNPSMPVFDKPVYDDDIFNGLPGIKSASVGPSSAAKFDDVFASIGATNPSSSPPPKYKPQYSSASAFDDLLGNLGRKETESKRESARAEKNSSADFDDLLPGFGPSISRSTSDSFRSQKPPLSSTKGAANVMEDPFVVLESIPTPAASSSGMFTDPLEEISKSKISGNAKVDNPPVNNAVFDDIDPLDNLGKSVPPVSPEVNHGSKDRSHSSTVSSTFSYANNEPVDKYPVDSGDGYPQKKMPSDDFRESHEPRFDIANATADFRRAAGQTASPPSYANANANETNSSPRSEEIPESSDDVWLTVSEIPLFTQPTSAPPPSRPPPPRPPRLHGRKKVNEYSSFPHSTSYSQSPRSARAARNSTSQIDELEEFGMGRTRNNSNEHADILYSEDLDTNSSAAESAAAMEQAMAKAEAKFKQMREREYLKASRSRDAVQLDKDFHDAQQRELRERQERLDRERQQKEREDEEREQRRLQRERERAREIEREREEKEREQRRLERERERAREEREKARQAVERATREARERAAAEARLKAERAAVDRAAAEARERAERSAVQRAQAEARERAANEARERAERAAAEAKERAAAEAREREERNAAQRAAADARARAERAAVERAAAEARERAAAEARERAAAAARANQQKSESQPKDDYDFDSFFSNRPSSAPRPRANNSDPLFDTQNRGGPEMAKRTSSGASSSMRKASSTANIYDDLSSLMGGAPSSGEFQEVEGETEERRRARLERHQRTQERAAKALAEKNQRDLQAQREQAERHRIAETLDAEIKRWAAGKEGNLRALLSTLQYVLWPECGWQPVSLTDLITGASVKKVYRKATLCIHPDKVQQKGANLQQKYVAEKVFDLLKEAWNKFNSEELF
ncbi:hypothetical protein Tsubulata_014868 [Turnera subulata]|uniref:J domain-containing protein n=1 Tax=Turnera subulata TaxID=218843 RepID=A0A9Q0GD04_9ROSI|nr:hypothetical protein Tsubulata_014868 [Turnera subulata]